MNQNAEPEFLTMSEAAALFGVSRVKLWRAAKAGRLETWQSERDRRATLVRRRDVEALLAPQPVKRTGR